MHFFLLWHCSHNIDLSLLGWLELLKQENDGEIIKALIKALIIACKRWWSTSGIKGIGRRAVWLVCCSCFPNMFCVRAITFKSTWFFSYSRRQKSIWFGPLIGLPSKQILQLWKKECMCGFMCFFVWLFCFVFFLYSHAYLQRDLICLCVSAS